MGGGDLFGLNIGASCIKVAHLQKTGDKKYRLVKFGMAPLSEGTVVDDEILKYEELQDAVLAAVKDAGLKLQNCAIGLFGPNSIAKRIQLAGGSREEIEEQVTWEAETYLPFDVDECVISFHIAGENVGGGVDVLVGAAKTETINSFKGMVEELNFNVKVVDLDVIAVTNLFELLYGNELPENQSALILDLGAQKISMCIYRNRNLIFSKEITMGGSMITEEIQRQMGLVFDEAEDLKANGDANGNLPEEIIEIIDDVVEVFFEEINKTIEFYITSSSDESMSTCYVTGGTAAIPGILEGLEQLLDMNVKLMNPFEKIAIDQKKFSEEVINEIAFRGSVALGLAMREVGDD